MADEPTPAVPPAAPPAPAAAEQDETAQDKEWSQYVAISVIDHGGVRAYNRGDRVPASNVEQHGYLDAGLVAKTSTKAGQAALAGEPG